MAKGLPFKRQLKKPSVAPPNSTLSDIAAAVAQPPLIVAAIVETLENQGEIDVQRGLGVELQVSGVHAALTDAFKKRAHKTIPRAREDPRSQSFAYCAVHIGAQHRTASDSVDALVFVISTWRRQLRAEGGQSGNHYCRISPYRRSNALVCLYRLRKNRPTRWQSG